MSNTATLITGASSGIGEALARLLAAEKQPLVLVARRREKLENLAQELRSAHGVRVDVLAADLEQVGAAAALMRQVEGLGLSVDTLINNAGFGINAEFADQPADRVTAMMQLNIVALTELTHAVLPGMLRRGQGRIMNIASVAAFQPCPRFAEYGASKAYVLSFSEALAEEVASKGVRVTAVCPGATRTEFHDVAHNDGTFIMRFMDSAETVAEQALRALNGGTRVIVTGLMNKPLPLLVRLTPRRVVAWLAGKMSEPKAA